MRDLLVGGGGVKAGRIPTEHAHLDCSPVVVIGGCGHRDPLGVWGETNDPAEGLWLVDAVAVSTDPSHGAPPSRLAVLAEVPLNTPPAILAALTLLGSVLLVVGSEVHCCFTLRQYLQRLSVLRTGVTDGAPSPSRAGAHSRGSAAVHACYDALSDAVELARQLKLQSAWPCSLPQLRVVITEAPNATVSRSGEPNPTVSEVIAGTSPAEIDALIRTVGAECFSSVVIARCRDGDAGSVTHDIVTHAPPRRLAATSRALPASAWLELVADAYSRVQSWRHIAGRSTLGNLRERIEAALEAAANRAETVSNSTGGNITATTATSQTRLPAATTTQRGDRSMTAVAAQPPPVSANASTVAAGTAAHDATAGRVFDAALGELLEELDAAQRRMSSSALVDSRDWLEAHVKEVLRPRWDELRQAGETAARRETAMSAAMRHQATLALVRLGQTWLDDVCADLDQFRSAAAANTTGPTGTKPNKTLLNSTLVDVMLQWVMPNAAVVSRQALEAVTAMHTSRVKELQTQLTAANARLAAAERGVATAESALAAKEQEPRRPDAEQTASAVAEAVRHNDAKWESRLHQISRQAEALDKRVADFTADFADTQALWRRRYASSEFLAANFESPQRAPRGGVDDVAAMFSRLSMTPPPPPASKSATTNRSSATTAAAGRGNVTMLAGAVDETALTDELRRCYNAVLTMGDKVTAFAAEYSRLKIPAYHTQSTNGPSAAAVRDLHGTSSLDASSIRVEAPNALAQSVRAARQAATAASTLAAKTDVISKTLHVGQTTAAGGASTAQQQQQHILSPVFQTPPTSDMDDSDVSVYLAPASRAGPQRFLPLTSEALGGRGGGGDEPKGARDRETSIYATADVQAAADDTAGLRQALQRATGALRELQQAFENRSEALSKAQDECNDLRAHVEASAASARRTLHDNQILRTEINRLLHVAGELESCRKELDAVSYQARTQATTIDVFSTDKSRLERLLADANENRSMIERQVADISGQCVGMRETIDSLEERLRDVEQELYAANSARKLAENNCESLRTELAVMRAEFDELEQGDREHRRLIAEMKAEQTLSEAAHRDLVTRLDEEVAHLKRTSSETEMHLRASVEEHRASVDRLRQELVDQQAALEAAIAREHYAHQAHAAAYNDLTSALVEKDALQTSLADQDKRVERAAKSLSLLRDENAALRQRASRGSSHHTPNSPTRHSGGGANNSRYASPEPWGLDASTGFGAMMEPAPLPVSMHRGNPYAGLSQTVHQHYHRATQHETAGNYSTRAAPQQMPRRASIDASLGELGAPGSRSGSDPQSLAATSRPSTRLTPTTAPPRPLPRIAERLLGTGGLL
jgi:predicted  nucleic acid-binding Zn-ribbon protein